MFSEKLMLETGE